MICHAINSYFFHYIIIIAQAIEIARLQEQMRQQQTERQLKERENAELRRQLQSAQLSPPAQPQKITAAVRRVSKPEVNMLLCTLCAIMHVHVQFFIL